MPRPTRQVADRRGVSASIPVVRKRSSAVAGRVDHAERGVPRARELGGCLDQPLEDGVERELGGERDAGLDEAAAAVPARRSRLHYLQARRGALSVTPEVPSCCTPAVGGSRQDVRKLMESAVAAEMGDDEPRAVGELDDEAPTSGNSLGLRPADPHLRDVLEANPARPPAVDGRSAFEVSPLAGQLETSEIAGPLALAPDITA